MNEDKNSKTKMVAFSLDADLVKKLSLLKVVVGKNNKVLLAEAISDLCCKYDKEIREYLKSIV